MLMLPNPQYDNQCCDSANNKSPGGNRGVFAVVRSIFKGRQLYSGLLLAVCSFWRMSEFALSRSVVHVVAILLAHSGLQKVVIMPVAKVVL